MILVLVKQVKLLLRPKSNHVPSYARNKYPFQCRQVSVFKGGNRCLLVLCFLVFSIYFEVFP